MAGKNNMIPLHKTVHWRNLRTIIKEGICYLCGANLWNYFESNSDLKHIRCYRCKGIDLHGRNVEFAGLKGRHCFVDDNDYEIFEIPFKIGDNKYDEHYYVFAHNVSFDYWIIAKMSIKNEIRNQKYYRTVKYDPLFDGAITFNNGRYLFTKETSEYSCKRGKMNSNRYFDQDGARASAYGETYSKYLKSHYGQQKKIVDTSSVKIYKKQQKKGK